MKSIKNKWTLSIAIIMLISLTNSATLNTMEKNNNTKKMNNDEKEEFFFYLKEVFPPEVMEKIQLFMTHDEIEFLSMQPNRIKIGTNTELTAIALSNDKAVIGTKYGYVEMYNIHTNELLHTFQEHADNSIISIRIHNDTVEAEFFDCKNIESQLSNEYSLIKKTWNIETGELLNTLISDMNTTDIYRNTNILSCTNPYVLRLYSRELADKIHGIKTNKVLACKSNFNPKDFTILNDDYVGKVENGVVKTWPLSPYNGISKNNPLTWIIRHATMPQFLLIKQICTMNMKSDHLIRQDFVIPCLSENGKIFLEFPKEVQLYLLSHLDIWLRR